MSFALKVILVLLIVLLLEVYFFKTVSRATELIIPKLKSKKLSLIKWISIIVINIFPIYSIVGWIYTYITRGGFFNTPDYKFFDYLIVYPFWLGTIIIVQSTLIFLIIEFINIILILILKSNKLKYYRAVLILIAFLLSIIYVPYRIVHDYYNIEVRNVEFKKTNLPEALMGFKIVFISDIQVDKFNNGSRIENYIKKVNEQNPDLVLIAGDLITSTPVYIKTAANEVGKIKAKHGVYSCVGDHDNWAYRGNVERSLEEVSSSLQNVGIPMIDNNLLHLGIDSAKINIVFITNTYVERIDEEELNKLTQQSSSSEFNIFLTHQPRKFLIDKAKEKGFDIYLCGHTHGGQITFLFPFLNLTPTLVETDYIKGDFKFGNMLMIVTRGLGMSLAPVRYNSTPEITVITLNK